jgi:cellobiose transport system permease protein
MAVLQTPVPPVRPAPGAPRRRSSASLTRPGPGTYLVLAASVLLAVFPLYWMFVVASNDSSAVNDVPPVLVPGPNFADQVRTVLEINPNFLRSFVNSFVVSGSIAVGQVFFSALAGFAFAKMRFRGRNVLFVAVIATMMVPVQLAVVPQFILISWLGWVNQLQALIIPGLVTAFGVFWMRQAIDNAIPDELVQAAQIDGAGPLRTFVSVVLPGVRPAASVLGLFAFMTAWNDFFWPLIVLNTPESFTVQVALRQLNAQAYVTDYGVQMAGIVLGTLPLLVLFVLLGRQIVGGIMEGALKS